MKIADKAVLITGANRGIGRALVDDALSRGAKRVYAATRVPFFHPDARVVPLIMDVTNAEQIQEALTKVESLDVLINNAGLALFDDLTDRAALDRVMAVNLFGTLAVTQTFLPMLARSGGAVVNCLSIAALAPLPIISAYSISKAAALSLTQSLRALVAARGVSVHAVMIGPTDTDMTRGIDIPKSAPETTADGILGGVERGEEDIFPDVVSQTLAEGWRNGVAKELERQNARFVPAQAEAA